VKRTVKVILGLITALAVLVCGFVWGYTPIRNERLKIKNASHFSNLDQPEEVAQAINEFVNRNR
jgi:pimeloyl-ACP methyl ester carboxylesterase